MHDIEQACGYDIFGLDGALEFDGSRRLTAEEMSTLVQTALPLLEEHYGTGSAEVPLDEFNRRHPLATQPEGTNTAR